MEVYNRKLLVINVLNFAIPRGPLKLIDSRISSQSLDLCGGNKAAEKEKCTFQFSLPQVTHPVWAATYPDS